MRPQVVSSAFSQCFQQRRGSLSQKFFSTHIPSLLLYVYFLCLPSVPPMFHCMVLVDMISVLCLNCQNTSACKACYVSIALYNFSWPLYFCRNQRWQWILLLLTRITSFPLNDSCLQCLCNLIPSFYPNSKLTLAKQPTWHITTCHLCSFFFFFFFFPRLFSLTSLTEDYIYVLLRFLLTQLRVTWKAASKAAPQKYEG